MRVDLYLARAPKFRGETVKVVCFSSMGKSWRGKKKSITDELHQDINILKHNNNVFFQFISWCTFMAVPSLYTNTLRENNFFLVIFFFFFDECDKSFTSAR